MHHFSSLYDANARYFERCILVKNFYTFMREKKLRYILPCMISGICIFFHISIFSSKSFGVEEGGMKAMHRRIPLEAPIYLAHATKEFRGFSVFPTDRCQFSRYRVTRPGKGGESISPLEAGPLDRQRESREIILLRCSVINFFLLRELYTPETHPFRFPRWSGVGGSFYRATLLCHL